MRRASGSSAVEKWNLSTEANLAQVVLLFCKITVRGFALPGGLYLHISQLKGQLEVFWRGLTPYEQGMI